MDWTTLILIWLSIGFIGILVAIIIESPGAGHGWDLETVIGLIISIFGGPIAAVYFIKLAIQDKREKEKRLLQLKLKKEKEKEELRAAKAERRQRIAAEKAESKERYGKLLSELEMQMKSYEGSGEPPPKKFIADAATLGADACNIPKSGLKKKKTLINVLRYARLNIYTIFEGNALKQGKKHADSLGFSIERLSK